MKSRLMLAMGTLLTGILYLPGCGSNHLSNGVPIPVEGVIEESATKEIKDAQQWIKKLLNAAREDSISPESLKFLAPGIKIDESVESFLDGHKWLARWEFGTGTTKDRVHVILYFTDLEFHWGDPQEHIRVERVYEVKKSGNGVTIKRGS
ncbi:MAG: hypothetical protein MUC43_00300 [Pirellula sp.]|jgi:hypothetical protein|nr:hypothetical protein [Pirellula sp.]